MLDSPFVIKLESTFQDDHFVYFVLELAAGGNLGSKIRGFNSEQRRQLLGPVASFYASCSVLALEHLHHRRICYRDLKVDNIMLNAKGYGKLCDMGWAKFTFGRTFTFAGTPEYMAPEVIAQTGHNVAVDWWALGILIYALLAGQTPADAHGHGENYLNAFALARKGYAGWGKKTAHGKLGLLECPADVASGDWTDALSVCACLCVADPGARLPLRPEGLGQLKAKPFFAKVAWAQLEDQAVPAPIVPEPAPPAADRELGDAYAVFVAEETQEKPTYGDGPDPFKNF